MTRLARFLAKWGTIILVLDFIGYLLLWAFVAAGALTMTGLP